MGLAARLTSRISIFYAPQVLEYCCLPELCSVGYAGWGLWNNDAKYRSFRRYTASVSTSNKQMSVLFCALTQGIGNKNYLSCDKCLSNCTQSYRVEGEPS